MCLAICLDHYDILATQWRSRRRSLYVSHMLCGSDARNTLSGRDGLYVSTRDLAQAMVLLTPRQGAFSWWTIPLDQRARPTRCPKAAQLYRWMAYGLRMAGGSCISVICSSSPNPKLGHTRQSRHEHRGLANSAHDCSYCIDRDIFYYHSDQQTSDLRVCSPGRT